jgi:hypothetical protein
MVPPFCGELVTVIGGTRHEPKTKRCQHSAMRYDKLAAKDMAVVELAFNGGGGLPVRF